MTIPKLALFSGMLPLAGWLSPAIRPAEIVAEEPDYTLSDFSGACSMCTAWKAGHRSASASAAANKI
jgi:hypothetical protein